MDVPGAAHLSLAPGVVHLDEPAAVLGAMVSGWARQMKSRLLADATVASRVRLIERFAAFAETYLWE